MIPYGQQSISAEDEAAVLHVLRSGFLTQGPAGPLFESAVAEYCAAPHAVAFNSATSALHVACLALELGPGDLLWTTPITFVASANCARYCGADVDFVDIDSATCNVSAAALEAKLQTAQQLGRLPKVLVAVHLRGVPCAMDEVGRLAQEYGFAVIEDASHAIGARYLGSPVGSCRYSDITVFSFHAVKVITAGEGGMATTRDRELARRMRLLRSHGVSRDPEEMTCEPKGEWYYEQLMLGFNYRMTDIQAALGLSQLQRIDSFLSRRKDLADRYETLLAPLPVTVPAYQSGADPGLHLFVIRLDEDVVGRDRNTVFSGMRQRGIGVNLHYIPVYRQPYYRQFGYDYADFPQSERYYRDAMTIPLHPAMSEADQDTVIAALTGSLP